MADNKIGQSLHDRSTRGETLGPEEHAQLQLWYAQMDQAENAVLRNGSFALATNAELRKQVNGAVAQLLAVSQRIQTQTADNEKLREEIASLKRQLAQKHATQPV